MPSFDNTPYIRINVGDSFGIIDIVGSSATKKFDLECFLQNTNKLQRQFTIMSTVDNCEILTLSIQDLNRMKLEFHDCYEKLF